MTERKDLDEYKLSYNDGNDIELPRGVAAMHITGGMLKDGAFHPEVYMPDWSEYRSVPFSYYIPVGQKLIVRRIA